MLSRLRTVRELRVAELLLPARNDEKLEQAKAYLGQKWILHPANKVGRRADASRAKTHF